MSGTLTAGDLAIEITMRQGGIAYIDYEPRGIPGFESDIAKVLDCDPSQTDALLGAVDDLGHHFRVTREVVRPKVDAGKKAYPARIRVVITMA